MAVEIEIWYKATCPKCGKVNWIYAGYEPDSDMSKFDVTACQCWECKISFDLVEEDEFSMGCEANGREKPE